MSFCKRHFLRVCIILFLCCGALHTHAQSNLLTLQFLPEVSYKKPLKYCYVKDTVRLLFDYSIDTILSITTGNGVVVRNVAEEYYPASWAVVPAHAGTVLVKAKALTSTGGKRDTVIITRKFKAIKPPQIEVKVVWDSLVLKEQYSFEIVYKKSGKKVANRWGIGSFLTTYVYNENDSLIDTLVDTGIGFEGEGAAQRIGIKNGYKIRFWVTVVDYKRIIVVPTNEVVYTVGTLNKR